jgi:hypothetical protein
LKSAEIVQALLIILAQQRNLDYDHFYFGTKNETASLKPVVILYQLQSLCEMMSQVLTSGETSPGKMPFCQTLKWLFPTKILNSHKVPDYCDNISQPIGFRNRAPTRP